MIATSTIYADVDDVKRLLTDDSTIVLIDSRTPDEFAAGHVPGAVNVPVDELTDFARTRRYLPDDMIVTMCGSTGRGEKASSILSSCGLLNVQVMEGGLKAWQDAGHAINRRP